MKIVRIIVDILMLVFLIMCIPSSRNGFVGLHIIEGSLFALLAVIHFYINRKWVVSVSKTFMSGKLKGIIKRQLGVDWLLVMVWGFSIITGFLALGFSVWGIESFFGFVRVHGISARLGGILICVHLVQHRKQIISYFVKKKTSAENIRRTC